MRGYRPCWVLLLLLAGMPLARAEMGARYCQQDITPVTGAVGAYLATLPYPNSGTTTAPFTSGSVTIKGLSGSSLNLGNWSDAIPFDGPGPDIAFNGDENFELDFAAPVYSLAFEYDTPGADQPAFVVRFYHDSTLVGTDNNFRPFRFFSPQGPFNCFGFWLDQAFNRVVFSEQDNYGQNEYFGRIFTGIVAPPASKLWPLSGEANYGWSLAAAGDILAVGSWKSAVDIYLIHGPGKLPSLVTHIPLALGAVQSAADLDMDGVRVAIGNAGPDVADPGSVLVASPDNQGYYTQIATLSPPSSNDVGFGAAVAIDDPYLVVGAPLTPSGSGLVAGEGKAFVYQRSGNAWNLMATLDSPTPTQGRHFGTDVEIQGDDVFISADGPKTGGTAAKVYLYQRSGSAWLPDGSLDVPAPGAATPLAGRLSLEGNVLAVTIPAYSVPDFCCYAVAIYSLGGGTWSLDSVVEPDNATGFPVGTGIPVVVHGGHVFLGQPSPFDFFLALEGKSCAQELAPDGTGNWVTVADHVNFMTLLSDQCGRGLAVSDHFVFVGAPYDSPDTSIGNDFTGTSLGSGGVAVFQRSIFWDGFDH